MPKQKFEPIIMTGCDEEAVHKKGTKNYRIPFSLSGKPCQDWEDCFKEQWKSRQKQDSSQKAKAYIRKNELVLLSPLADVGVHFEHLKADIDTANKQHAEQIAQKEGKESEKKRKREAALEEEKRAIHAALEGLNFKSPKGSRRTSQ